VTIDAGAFVIVADSWIQKRPCRVTIDTGPSATVARPDIVAGLPERELSRPYMLQTASGETIPVVKEARVELTIGRHTLRSWVFVADIADDFILGLDLLRAFNASVDIGRRVLQLSRDEVPVREAPTAAVWKRTRPTKNRRYRRPVCCQCGRTGHLWRECPRGPARESVDKSDWRRDCATEVRSEARRQIAEAPRAPPCLTHQSDEKQRLDACEAALERQNEGLKARVAELEAALERKARGHD
jgi:predicted aspartyl protease